jgi:flagellar biosynthesis/type III secretory pathway chaperone
MESQIQAVARLLETEISHYEKLVAALRNEADHLRKGSTEDLLQSVKMVSEHADAIHQIHQDVRKKIEEMLNSAGNDKVKRTLADLIRLLPPRESRMLQKYQGNLEKLKSWVIQINSRNKGFLQETLAHWRGLFTLANPTQAASPVYVPNGRQKLSTPQPISVDRKV